MKKNPQFKKLLDIAERICDGSANIIAKSSVEYSPDSLHYNPHTKTFLYEYFRHEGFQPILTGSILQREDGICPFTFHIHEYNGKPPYLEINLGNITSILYFVD